MYRSNDVVQFEENSIFVRPFVKVGEPSENVKVLKYFIKKDLIEECEENGPNGHYRSNLRKIGDFFKNVFSTHPKFSTKPYQLYEKGHIEEMEFATTVWDSQ